MNLSNLIQYNDLHVYSADIIIPKIEIVEGREGEIPARSPNTLERERKGSIHHRYEKQVLGG